MNARRFAIVLLGEMLTLVLAAVVSAKGATAPALMIDYRLASDHPFPAALDDALAAYRRLIELEMPARPIALAGDSAGGGLVIAAMIHVRRSNWRAVHASTCSTSHPM